MFSSSGQNLFFKALVGKEGPRRTIHLEGEPVELIEVVLGAGMRTFDLPDVTTRDVEELGKIILRVTASLPVVFDEPDDRQVELRFSCLLHRPCKKMKRMCYLAYKIISKMPMPLAGQHPNRIEDLLYRIQSNVDVTTAEHAIARLPGKYGVVVDLHYGWGLSRREIAALLGWSKPKVSQRLTRGVSLLKYQLHPEAFQQAVRFLQQLSQNTK